ncbi:MAG: response regulator [Firmicutes bacterium]|nr:response regulator [Bacillota bacterium]
MGKHGFVDLGFSCKSVPVGSHICLFYRDQRRKNRMLLNYILAGIQNGEKVICLLDSMTKEELLDWIQREQVDTGGVDLNRSLFVARTQEVYYPDGVFVPEEMVARWRRFVAEAMAEGFSMLRVTGETDWLAQSIPGTERFVEYEMMINESLCDYPITVLCQINTNQIPGTTLLDLITVHSHIVANGQLFYNPSASSTGSKQSPRRFSFRKKKRENEERTGQIFTLLVAIACVLETLPTLQRKAEYTAAVLETVFQLKEFRLYLEDLTPGNDRAFVEGSLKGQSETVNCPIRTAESCFGHLCLPQNWVKVNPRFYVLILNFLNLLTLSLERVRYKHCLEMTNQQLKKEIMEKEKIETILRQNEQWFKVTMEGTDQGLWEWDTTTQKIKFDDNWQRILGYEPGEMVFDTEWFQRNVHPDDWPAFDQALRKYLDGVDKYIEMEYRIKTKSGEWKWVSSRGFCLDDKDGVIKPFKLSGTNRDITLYRQTQDALQASVQELAAERERAELLKIEKLESLGILASGIAHDFNNLLAAILSNVQLAVLKWEKGMNAIKDLQSVEKATLKASKLTHQLMAFAKGGAPVKQPARLGEIIKETAEFALRGASVKCQYLLPTDLWPVAINGDQISQVIHNLILNAYHAMPDGGVITVSARNVTVSQQNRMRLQPGKYVRVEVKDQGEGIPHENLTKIFDPYFTTKKEGNGLGLSSSYYIIQNHDGYLGVQSQPGIGTTFYFYLPGAVEEPLVENNKQRQERPERKCKVLLMDDEPLIRTSLRDHLAAYGYEAVVAKDGVEAVKLFQTEKKKNAPFDVVILDLTVPGGMGAKEAVRQILTVEPKAKVIASSGYSDDPVMLEYRKFGFCDVVFKPFKVEVLCAKIRKLLETAAGTD